MTLPALASLNAPLLAGRTPPTLSPSGNLTSSPSAETTAWTFRIAGPLQRLQKWPSDQKCQAMNRLNTWQFSVHQINQQTLGKQSASLAATQSVEWTGNTSGLRLEICCVSQLYLELSLLTVRQASCYRGITVTLFIPRPLARLCTASLTFPCCTCKRLLISLNRCERAGAKLVPSLVKRKRYERTFSSIKHEPIHPNCRAFRKQRFLGNSLNMREGMAWQSDYPFASLPSLLKACQKLCMLEAPLVFTTWWWDTNLQALRAPHPLALWTWENAKDFQDLKG